mmetsp:Transcript_681/g.867  ORF Transcript_681/g.867 Transcript_681/m.867 type:complete len:97 (+) Transcript_681:60-350(+)
MLLHFSKQLWISCTSLKDKELGLVEAIGEFLQVTEVIKIFGTLSLVLCSLVCFDISIFKNGGKTRETTCWKSKCKTTSNKDNGRQRTTLEQKKEFH